MKREKNPHSESTQLGRKNALRHPRRIPVALTIAGSDSGGGAGIQADLKTFVALGVHGTTAVTCITAQNPRRVAGVESCKVSLVRKQLAAVLEELSPAVAKTGMLYSASIIQVVAEFVRRSKISLVVDPVMISTSGAQLLHPGAVKVLCRRLLPLATLITPNLREAEVLVDGRIKSVEDMRRVAKELHKKFGTATLIKGGHVHGLKEAVDIFYSGTEELLLSAPFIRGINTHGTGCTYSAAITAYIAKGLPLRTAVIMSKEFITQAIAQSRVAAGHHVLNSFWRGRPS